MMYGIAVVIFPTFALGGIGALPEFIHQIIAFNTGSEIMYRMYCMSLKALFGCGIILR